MWFSIFHVSEMSLKDIYLQSVILLECYCLNMIPVFKESILLRMFPIYSSQSKFTQNIVAPKRCRLYSSPQFRLNDDTWVLKFNWIWLSQPHCLSECWREKKQNSSVFANDRNKSLGLLWLRYFYGFVQVLILESWLGGVISDHYATDAHLHRYIYIFFYHCCW